MSGLYTPIHPETFVMQVLFTATDSNLAYCRLTPDNIIQGLHQIFESVTIMKDSDQITFHIDEVFQHPGASTPNVFVVSIRVDQSSATAYNLVNDTPLTYGVLYFKLIKLFETYYSENGGDRKFNGYRTLSKFLGDAPCPNVRRVTLERQQEN